MSATQINLRCFQTYQFVLTRPIGGKNYVGYTGYKRCNPFLKNPLVDIYVDGVLWGTRSAPDMSGYQDFYGEEFQLDRQVNNSVRFVVRGSTNEVDVTIDEVPKYTCTSEPCSISGANVYGAFGLRAGTSPSADISYTVNNITGVSRGAKLELWLRDVKVSESTAVVANNSSATLRVTDGDSSTSQWSWRTYKYKLFDCDTLFSTCNLVEVGLWRVWYYGGDMAGAVFSDYELGSDLQYFGWVVSPSTGRAGDIATYYLWFLNMSGPDKNVNISDGVNSVTLASTQYKINITNKLTRSYPSGRVVVPVYVDGSQLGQYVITGRIPTSIILTVQPL
jgi:hypothetical protein